MALEERAGESLGAGRVLRSPLLWCFLAVWVLTRAFVLARVGIWDGGPIDYQDVNTFSGWAAAIAHHGALPNGPAWQYPPGAAFLMLLPRLGPGSYGTDFIGLMLLFDLAGLACVYAFARRQGCWDGVWAWLLGVPLLASLPVLRFDLVPTVITVAALILLARRPRWFGALAGAGFAIKLWPLVALLGEWDRRRLGRAALAAALTATLVFIVAGIAFGDSFSFISAQGGRGLQVESVGAVPWQLRRVVLGTPFPEALQHGAWEVTDGGADAVAAVFGVLVFAVLTAAATWWFLRDRAIRAGRVDLADPDLARDFVFAVVLLFIVTSRVLSPQYMLWVLGTGALVLSSPRSRVRRAAWIALAALAISYGLTVRGSAADIVIRDLALVVAAFDACRVLCLALARPTTAAATGAPRAPE